MWGAIIGAGLSAASALIGNSQARKAQQKREAYLDEKERRDNSEYSRLYNQDWTQTAGAQNALRKSSQQFRDAIAGARARQGVLGVGSEQEVADMQNRAAEAMGETTASIVEQGEARAESIRQQHKASQDTITAQRMGIEQEKAQQATLAAQYGVQAGLGMVGADMQSHLANGKGMFETAFGKKKSNVGSVGSTQMGGTSTSSDLAPNGMTWDQYDKLMALGG